MKKELVENQLTEQMYELPRLNKLKLGAIILGIIGLAFLINFSFEEIIKDNIKNVLQMSPTCKLGYSRLELDHLPPQVVLKNPALPGSCFGTSDKNVYLSDLFLKFRGISIVPFGPKFLLTSKVKNSEFFIYPSVGLNSQAINIEDTIIDLDTFPQIFEGQGLFSGKVDIRALVGVTKGSVDDVKLKLKSSNFKIVPQNINVPLPMVNLQELGLKAVMNAQKNLNLETLTFGTDSTPLKGIISGDIKFGPFGQTVMDLKAEVKFSSEILKNYSMIDSFLSARGISIKNGFYQMRIKGNPNKKNALGLPDLEIVPL